MAAAISGSWDDELVLRGAPTGNVDVTADDHVLWLAQAQDGTTSFFWDGRSSEPFEFLPQHDGSVFAWAPGDRHIAYYGRRSGNYFVGIDGAEHGPYDGITRSVPPTFSLDGEHVAYGVFQDGQARMIVDGIAIGSWRPAPIKPVFSVDGKRLAFAAENREITNPKDRKDYRQWIVVDGVAGPEAEGISAGPLGIQFSPDGRRFLYGRIDGGKVRLVVDGVPWPAFPEIGFPTFSPDGSRIVYAAGQRGQMRLAGDGIGDGTSGAAYEAILPPVFSPDGARLAFGAIRSKGRLVVAVDRVEGPEFAELWANPVFSPDGRSVAYLAQRRGTGFLARPGPWVIVVDGIVHGDWDAVASAPHFSPDGRRLAFSGRRDRAWSIVVDGNPGPSFDQVSPPEFGTSGRLAYLAVKGGEKDPNRRFKVAVEGIEMPEVEAISTPDGVHAFHFSPDGEHVASFGRIAGTWRPIVDGHVGPGSQGIGRARFEGQVVSFVAVAEDGVHRVTNRLT